MKKVAVFMIFLGLGAVLTQATASIAHACACCGNEGSYFRGRGTPSVFEKEALQALKVEGRLDEGAGEAGTGESWRVEGAFKVDTLTLKVSRDGKVLGDLRFKARGPFDILSTDLIDVNGPVGNGIQYKQYEMTGAMVTNVPALKKIAGSKVTLVIKGTGNACTLEANQWIFEAPVKSPESGLYGYGKLTPENP